MQLYALDDSNNPIYADRATKKQNYFCMECQGIVRIRRGIHRHHHYYHLSPSPSCHLSKKSMTHIQIQTHIHSLLPAGECRLEQQFPKIKRIADVVWIPKKLIFEVQCSSITAAEVKQRNLDYASEGFQVIWILHDARYNQWRFTAAELYLRSFPFYFTNIDADGKGKIYDQFDCLHKGMRTNKLASVSINIHEPKTTDSLNPIFLQQIKKSPKIPIFIKKRILTWPVYFIGDLTHRSLFSSSPEETFYTNEIIKCENAQIQQGNAYERKKGLFIYLKHLFSHGFSNGIIRPYLLLLQMLLEKACK